MVLEEGDNARMERNGNDLRSAVLFQQYYYACIINMMSIFHLSLTCTINTGTAQHP